MSVAPLQLPQLINVPQLNFAPLNEIGDAIAGYRQRSALADALPGMLGQQPQQGNSLATLGQPQPAAGGNANSAIGGIESGNNYTLLGPITKTGDRAYGKYQVMGANIPEWSKEVLGRSLTPQEFLASPQAQDAVFNAKFGQYAQKYGPEGAARAWFAGEGGMNNPAAKDQLGTTVSDYANKFRLAFNGENPPLPSAITQGAQPSISQPGGASMQPPQATAFQQPTNGAPVAQAAPAVSQPQATAPQSAIPPDTMARIQAMIRAGGPAQQFAMALLQKYVVPQQPVVVGEGAIAVNPVTGQVIARGQPKSYAVAQNGSLVTPGQPGAAPGGSGSTVYTNTTGQLTPSAVDSLAKRVISGDHTAINDVGGGTLGNAAKAQILNRVDEIYRSQGMTPGDIVKNRANTEAQINAVEAFNPGHGPGDTVKSLDVAVDHLATLQQYVDALGNGSVPVINAIRNKWREETGSDLPTNLEAIRPIVTGEVAKAVIGSNNALSDREELRKAVETSGSPQQLGGAIGAYTALMSGQLRGLQRQYEYTTKQKDFQDRLSPHTVSVLTGKQSTPAQSAPVQKVTTRDDANAAIAAARAAIAKGADPKAVNERLQKMGIPPLAAPIPGMIEQKT